MVMNSCASFPKSETDILGENNCYVIVKEKLFEMLECLHYRHFLINDIAVREISS